jgi:RNA polymerase sigma factor (sigma-70 family)
VETEEGAATSAPLPSDAGRPERGAAGALVGRYFSAHGRMVLGLCRLLLRDRVEAEDAAQQVFLSAHRALIAGAVPRDPPAWLAAIARNECRGRIRGSMRSPVGLPEPPADLPDPLAVAIRSADLDAVWAALSALPRRQRKAFLLRELVGLSYVELGAALGVTRPAVESLLFRARRHLRDALAGANAALVPLALRDQLVRLVPEFGGGAPAAAVPAAAKVAALTAGLGLGAVTIVELPDHHRVSSARARVPRVTQQHARRPPIGPSSAAARSVVAAPARGAAGDRPRRSGERARRAEGERQTGRDTHGPSARDGEGDHGAFPSSQAPLQTASVTPQPSGDGGGGSDPSSSSDGGPDGSSGPSPADGGGAGQDGGGDSGPGGD